MGRHLEGDWFPTSLPDNVYVGSDSWLYSSFAFLHYQSRLPRGVAIGKNSGIYIGTLFDLGSEGSVEIGDFCTIVGAIISSNGHVRIGNYGLIAHEVIIAASSFGRPPLGSEPKSAEIIIGNNVWIGMRAVILGGISIGDGAVIGAASVVDFDVPPLSLVAGNPAHVVKTFA
jgi:acetyltransferase-like isoleucine patch superfamily enzyme